MSRVLLILLLSCSTARSAELPLAQLAVDMVKVKNGPRLLGAVARRDQQQLTIAVQREWLKARFPEYFQQQTRQEQQLQFKSRELLLKRIDDWKLQASDSELLKFLEEERERVQQELTDLKANPAEVTTQFLLITLTVDQVQSLVMAEPERKQWALLAWKAQLPDVEGSTAGKLQRLLKEQNITDLTQMVDLSDRVPKGGTLETEQQWAARRALVELRFVQELAFQGTGDTVFRTGAGAPPPDLTQVMQQLLTDGIADQLAELFQEPGLGAKPKPQDGWRKQAIAVAEQEGVSGFRVTLVKQDIAAKQARVEIYFLARMPDQSWKTVWQGSVTESAAQARPELEAQIKENAEVKQALELAGKLGLGEENLTLALRFGAATMQAQQTAEAQFYKFWDGYNNQLDTSPVPLPPG